jgi:hypothetical protein
MNTPQRTSPIPSPVIDLRLPLRTVEDPIQENHFVPLEDLNVSGIAVNDEIAPSTEKPLCWE